MDKTNMVKNQTNMVKLFLLKYSLTQKELGILIHRCERQVRRLANGENNITDDIKRKLRAIEPDLIIALEETKPTGEKL